MDDFGERVQSFYLESWSLATRVRQRSTEGAQELLDSLWRECDELLQGTDTQLQPYREARIRLARNASEPTVVRIGGVVAPSWHDAAFDLANRLLAAIDDAADVEPSPGERNISPEAPTVDFAADDVLAAVANCDLGDIDEMQAQLSIERTAVKSIPPQQVAWSRPMSLGKAAKLLGYVGTKPSEWIKACIADGIYRARENNRQSWQFDLDTIDESVRDKFRPGAMN